MSNRKRIRKLERRVAELESKHKPFPVPTWVPPVPPTRPPHPVPRPEDTGWRGYPNGTTIC